MCFGEISGSSEQRLEFPAIITHVFKSFGAHQRQLICLSKSQVLQVLNVSLSKLSIIIVDLNCNDYIIFVLVFFYLIFFYIDMHLVSDIKLKDKKKKE